MKILEKEIDLREETRATDQVREAMGQAKHGKRSESLAATQVQISEMNTKTLKDIEELEETKGVSFPTEKQMLRRVGTIMTEVTDLLTSHDTGSHTIAAETEIIELLLQVQRKPPPKKNSKGGGGSQPGSGGEGDTEESALALIGRGDEANAQRTNRSTQQTTGAISAGYPVEYRSGLDTYFSELEKTN